MCCYDCWFDVVAWVVIAGCCVVCLLCGLFDLRARLVLMWWLLLPS